MDVLFEWIRRKGPLRNPPQLVDSKAWCRLPHWSASPGHPSFGHPALHTWTNRQGYLECKQQKENRRNNFTELHEACFFCHWLSCVDDICRWRWLTWQRRHQQQTFLHCAARCRCLSPGCSRSSQASWSSPEDKTFTSSDSSQLFAIRSVKTEDMTW